jgi:hypothetical protein
MMLDAASTAASKSPVSTGRDELSCWRKIASAINPEFSEFFMRRFSLEAEPLSSPGYVKDSSVPWIGQPADLWCTPVVLRDFWHLEVRGGESLPLRH